MRFPHRWLMALVLLIIGIQPVQAHGYIVRALPQDRVTLERPPARLQYWFSENLEPDFSTLVLRDQAGDVLAEGGVDPKNNALMTLQVPVELPDGAYLVDLRPAFASDGHVVAETRVFFVGQAAGDVAGASADYRVVPLEVIWRALLYTSTLLLFGAFALYALVLLPAWGNPDYAAGLLPPRVMRRLGHIVILALVIAFVGNGIAIIQQSMVFFNTGPAQVIQQGLWQVVRIGSRFGDVWTARMILLALIAVFFGLGVAWRDERPETVRAFWTANGWLAALMLGAFSVTSHAAGSLLLPWVAMLVDWAHTLAVAAWVGGLAVLTLVLPVALRPYEDEARRQALLIVLRRFSRLAMVALAVVITTGVYSSLNWLYQPSDLTQTSWGLALVVKLALVASLLVPGLMHHVAANPARYQRWKGWVQRTGVRTLRLEVLLGIVVLLSVAVLSASAVPEPVFLTEAVRALEARQTVDDYTVQLTISPGGPGVNTYDMIVMRDGRPEADGQVGLQVVAPEQDWRSDWLESQPADAGLYVVTGDQIADEGHWITLLNIQPADGEAVRAAFDWDISREAAIPTSIDPGLVNLLALVGVVLALGWTAWPLAYRFFHWLDWRPASVAVAGGALLLTALAIGAAIVLVNRSEESYNATFSPPPQVVNTVLPDATSLAAGRELYLAHCIEWQSYSDEFLVLKGRLARIRDETLYFATRDGWRDLPACSGNLTDEERWHIVNFFRTLA